MKKAITAAFCSAFIIPGLGQVVNRQIKKGVALLAAVFMALIFFIVNLYNMIINIKNDIDINAIDPAIIISKITDSDNSYALKYIVWFFCVIWIYSIIDALIEGIKIDKRNKDENK